MTLLSVACFSNSLDPPPLDSSGLLVKDMLTHPGSENHQWEGCKGLADLAARDSDGLSAVRRQGGIQVLLDQGLHFSEVFTYPELFAGLLNEDSCSPIHAWFSFHA